MRNEHELKENVAAADWRLTDAIRADIDRVFEEEGVPTHVDTPQALYPAARRPRKNGG